MYRPISVAKVQLYFRLKNNIPTFSCDPYFLHDNFISLKIRIFCYTEFIFAHLSQSEPKYNPIMKTANRISPTDFFTICLLPAPAVDYNIKARRAI